MPFFKTGPVVDPKLQQQGGIQPGSLNFILGREVPGRMTSMTCACGGALQELRHAPDIPLPPRPTHKKRRILKKRLKRWARETDHLKRFYGFMLLTQSPVYRCVACGRVQGLYTAMARNLFVIQPLS